MITTNVASLTAEIGHHKLNANKQIESTVNSIITFFNEQRKLQDANKNKSLTEVVLDKDIWCILKYTKSGSRKPSLYLCLLIQLDIDSAIDGILTRKDINYPTFDYPLQTIEHIGYITRNLITALKWYLQYCVGRYENFASDKLSPNNTYVKNLNKLESEETEIIKHLTDYYIKHFTPPGLSVVPENKQQLEILNKLKDKGYLIDRYDEETNTHGLTTPDGTPIDASVIKSIAKDVVKADIYRQAANRKGIDFRQSRATADNLISGDFGLTGREINNTHNDVSTDSLKSSLERRKPIKIKHDLHFNPELLKRNYH